jgi:sugar phosphate isomerase/epimerase
MRLTLQLYTVRDHLSNDLKGTLSKVKELGLDYVEIAGDYGQSATEWRQMLEELGLAASGSHIGVEALEADIEKVISDAKTIGYSFVIVPWVNASRYSEGWAAFGKTLEGLAEKLRAVGLTLCYHNHDFEFANGDGLAELYGSSDANLVQAEIDIAWVALGGHDPAQRITDLAGRVPLVHLKDFDKSKTPQWTPAGQGTIDFDAVLAACEKSGVQFGGIELDESPGDPLDAVAASIAFFATKGLK